MRVRMLGNGVRGGSSPDVICSTQDGGKLYV